MSLLGYSPSPRDPFAPPAGAIWAHLSDWLVISLVLSVLARLIVCRVFCYLFRERSCTRSQTLPLAGPAPHLAEAWAGQRSRVTPLIFFATISRVSIHLDLGRAPNSNSQHKLTISSRENMRLPTVSPVLDASELRVPQSRFIRWFE